MITRYGEGTDYNRLKISATRMLRKHACYAWMGMNSFTCLFRIVRPLREESEHCHASLWMAHVKEVLLLGHVKHVVDHGRYIRWSDFVKACKTEKERTLILHLVRLPYRNPSARFFSGGLLRSFSIITQRSIKAYVWYPLLLFRFNAGTLLAHWWKVLLRTKASY